LLGIDEGTTGVKAALFDQRLQPVAEARRDKVNRHPEEGWVEQDGEEVIAAVTEAVAELLGGADGEVVACGLDHQGESVLAWVAPNLVLATGDAPPRDRFLLRSREFVRRARIQVRQGGSELWGGRIGRLVPGRSAHIPAGWEKHVDPASGPVIVSVK